MNMNRYYSQSTARPNFYKEQTYNEEFYQSLSKYPVLPLIEQTKTTKLLHMVYQNQNASVSSTTGQLIVSIISIILRMR